jgi:hypothetical protein
MMSASTLAIISLPFIGLAAVFIIAALSPPEGPEFSWLNSTNTSNNNATNNSKGYTLPKVAIPKGNMTIGDYIGLKKSQAGFLYSMAAEEERPEPWASRISY